MAMKKVQFAIISTPGIGNLVPAVEFATHLTNTHPLFSATILVISLPQRPLVNDYIHSRAAASADNIRFLHLPPVDSPSPDQYQSSIAYISLLIEKHKQNVKHALTNLLPPQSNPDSVPFSALFVDMFCTSMIDVAEELGIPSYLYFASPATFLGFMLHLPNLDSKVNSESVDSELKLPGFANSVPLHVLPNFFLQRNDDAYSWFLHHARRYGETKGIIVNTFLDLEPFALNSLLGDSPPVYPVGPLIDHVGPAGWHSNRFSHEKIMKWLDGQPPLSVVFLCFGSMGSLSVDQVKEIAFGLERTGYRFLWSLREPPKGKLDLPDDYTNPEDVLPNGFLERNGEIGLVCGWVSQVTVLAHKAIGGFVSHCGWNSILESLWYGVPIATWPIYAEQQMNAFEMVRELKLAVEITLDYRLGGDLVLSTEVERGILSLMEGDSDVRENVQKMSEKCRNALMENGSSYESLTCLIKELTGI